MVRAKMAPLRIGVGNFKGLKLLTGRDLIKESVQLGLQSVVLPLGTPKWSFRKLYPHDERKV
jgi:hypothetical protein